METVAKWVLGFEPTASERGLVRRSGRRMSQEEGNNGSVEEIIGVGNSWKRRVQNVVVSASVSPREGIKKMAQRERNILEESTMSVSKGDIHLEDIGESKIILLHTRIGRNPLPPLYQQ